MWDRVRNRAERLLREPDNLFGPPTGQGYDYFRAAMTFAALVLAALSGWCLMAFDIGVLLVWLWPINLVIWAGAAVVWYATLHTAAYVIGLRQCGRAVGFGWGGVAAVGWLTGACLVVALW